MNIEFDFWGIVMIFFALIVIVLGYLVYALIRGK